MEYFESKGFIDSLLTQNKNALAFIYTLLANTNMISLLSSTLSDKFNKTNDSFQKNIAENAMAYVNWSEEELTLQIILSLDKIFKIAPNYYATSKDIKDHGLEITNQTAPILREIDSKFKGSTYDDFMQYQFEKCCKQSLEQFENLNDDEQDKCLNNVERFIELLPKEQQEQLKKEIGVEELTQEAIRKSIINGSFGIGLASLVGIGGFPIYMAAASFVSSVFGIIGLTLPFGFYTGMSSFIAVLANPLFLIPVLGLGGFVLFKNGKEKLNRMLALIVITQIAMAEFFDEEKKSPNRSNEVIAHWNNIVSQYNGLKKQLDSTNIILNEAKLLDGELQNLCQSNLKQKRDLQNVLAKNHSLLIKLIIDMEPNKLAINYYDNSLNTCCAEIIEHKKLLNDKQHKLIICQSEYINNPKDSDLYSKKKAIQKEISILQKSINEEIATFVTEIDMKAFELEKLKIDGFFKEYIEKNTELKKQLNEVVYLADQINSNLNKSKQILAKARSLIRGFEGEINVLNKQYYSIDKVHQFQEGIEL